MHRLKLKRLLYVVGVELAAIDDINRDPVVHTWTYRLNDVA